MPAGRRHDRRTLFFPPSAQTSKGPGPPGTEGSAEGGLWAAALPLPGCSGRAAAHGTGSVTNLAVTVGGDHVARQRQAACQAGRELVITGRLPAAATL